MVLEVHLLVGVNKAFNPKPSTLIPKPSTPNLQVSVNQHADTINVLVHRRKFLHMG